MPFEEIAAFDDDADTWTTFFNQYGAGGILVADVNGDDLPDVYFPQNGQNWTRATDDDGVLLDARRSMFNALYVNRGVEDTGNPIFEPLAEMAKGNDEYVKSELLVEGYLFPRTTAHDPRDGWGRSSNLAVAADFNNDGRVDILVGNEPPGMLWSHEETQRVMPQFVNPIGRETRKTKTALASMGPFLVDYEPRQSNNDERESARGDEYQGANSLFLNMGDADGDGLPEWRDASRETGIEGRRATYGLSVGDIDLDGDLDIFEANGPDIDYWRDSRAWAGGANQLYINQLAETGELRFVERAAEMDIDGVYDDDYEMPDYWRLRRIPFLPVEYSIAAQIYEPYKPDFLTLNGMEGEHGQISWASVMQDVNDDGYPDIWVANDMGYLRLYLNDRGKRFTRSEHARSRRSGYWTSFAPADFDGDTREDLFAGNLGGAVMNNAMPALDPADMLDPVIFNATINQQIFFDRHSTRHALISGTDFRSELPNKVQHSAVLPPDVSIPWDVRSYAIKPQEQGSFDKLSLDPYELAWGAAALDVQNDGRLDLYWVGGLYGRGGGIMAVTGTGPGRLLVNATAPGSDVRFVDQTAEHHVFNIMELDYTTLESDGYVSRRSPRLNWGKRDMVFSYDRSTWALHGPTVQSRIMNQDLIQTAENGRGVIAADLTGDGYPEIIVRNQGGYDSRRSNSVSLKARIDGTPRVQPAHDYNFPDPTNFEPGPTRLFVNRHNRNNWIKIRLLDDAPESYNRDAIGARVVVNGSIARTKRSGEGSFVSNQLTDLVFGLGPAGAATSVEIRWPDRDRTVSWFDLGPVHGVTLTISKRRGQVPSR